MIGQKENELIFEARYSDYDYRVNFDDATKLIDALINADSEEERGDITLNFSEEDVELAGRIVTDPVLYKDGPGINLEVVKEFLFNYDYWKYNHPTEY